MIPVSFYRALARLRAQFRSDRLDAELQEDLTTHLELLTDEYIRRGMVRDDARRAARLKFGSTVTAVDLHREARAFRILDTARIEFRMARRAVCARGWQATLALVLLASALAANTVVFSAADAFIFRPAPYPSLDRLVVLGPTDRVARPDRADISTRYLLAWRKQTDVLAAIHGNFPGPAMHGTAAQASEAIGSVRVTPGLLDMLGARVRWGRLLQAADAEAGARPVAVIGEDTARKLFGEASVAIGRRIVAERGMRRGAGPHEVEIVGVVDASFRYPTGRERVWIPLALTGPHAPVNMYNIALLAPGVSVEQASFAVAQRNDQLQGASRVYRRGYVLHRFADVRGDARYGGILLMLTAAAACLLLIACANVASLELAASYARNRAMAVHAALGAGWSALLRVRVLETGILVAASALVATLFAWIGTRAVTASLPPALGLQLSNAIDVDARAVGCLLAAAICAWAITLAPTLWRDWRADLVTSLRDDAGLRISGRGAWARHVLVVSQIAATVMLLVGALLYARSYRTKLEVPKGFDSVRTVAVSALAAPGSPLQGRALHEAIAETLSRHPAVESAAVAGTPPPDTSHGGIGPLMLDGQPANVSVKLSAQAVSPDYFSTMRIPIVRGRIFAADDSFSRVVVDETLARAFWPGQDPLGRRFGIEGWGMYRIDARGKQEPGMTYEVIGVAGSVRPDVPTIESGEENFIFYYLPDPVGGGASFVARLNDVEQLPAVVAAVRAAAPKAIVKGETIDERYALLEGDLRLAAWTTGSLAGLGIVIAALGVYAVMAFLVSTRTREIGVRMALGAGIRDIHREVFAASMRFVLAGAVFGLALAFAAARWIQSQLYGVSATDPATYALVIAGVLIVAAIATWHPAMTAAKVDPATALRHS